MACIKTKWKKNKQMKYEILMKRMMKYKAKMFECMINIVIIIKLHNIISSTDIEQILNYKKNEKGQHGTFKLASVTNQAARTTKKTDA